MSDWIRPLSNDDIVWNGEGPTVDHAVRKALEAYDEGYRELHDYRTPPERRFDLFVQVECSFEDREITYRVMLR